MSGAWRITVDSWISPDADWYGRSTYIVSGEHVHSLPAALAAIAESPAEVYMAGPARGESGVEPAPRTFTVPVCNHGRGRAHDECPGPHERKPLVPIWTVCPNGTCEHGLIVHDGDGDGPYVCCEDGCDCGKSA